MIKTIIAATLFVSASTGLMAQSINLDTGAACATVLPSADTFTQNVIGIWALGYQAKGDGTVTPVNQPTVADAFSALFIACFTNPDASLAALLDVQNTPAPDDSPPDPVAMLRQFYEPGADLAALTAQLRPSADDVRAVFDEPLASALIDIYDEAYSSGIVIRPKPEHSDIYAVITTTAELIASPDMQDLFPVATRGFCPILLPMFPS